jgi:hypothetical protein
MRALWVVPLLWLAGCDDAPGPCATDDIGPTVTSSDHAYVDLIQGQGEYVLTFSEPIRELHAASLMLSRAGTEIPVEVVPEGEGDQFRVTFSLEGWPVDEHGRLLVPGNLTDTCGIDLREDFAVDVVPYLSAVGEDLDEHRELDLASSYELPTEFYDALDTLGIDPVDLFYPDAGSTYESTPTRLPWTDTIRHQGDTAPTFAFMVVEQVEAALAASDPETRARELLAAQHVFNDRDHLAITRFDRQSAPIDQDAPLLEALRAFYEHAAVEGHPSPPAAPWSEVAPGLAARIEAFPFEAQVGLALAIQGLIAAAEMRDRALLDRGELTMAEWGELHRRYWTGRTGHSTYLHEFGTDAAPGLDFELLARAGQLAVRATESLRLALTAVEPVEGATLELVGPLGRVVLDLDGGDDEHRGDDFFLLVDLAGDDTYLDNVATNSEIYYPVSVVLDLAGNDRYTHSVDWTIESGRMALEATRMQGAGIFGVAVLVDSGGDDSYHASGVCQGAGVFGVGVLIDHGGADQYRGYTMCQGNADFGFGLLVDLGAGNDSYETWQKSQGYGGPRGVGWLVDEGGDDTYLAIAEPIIQDWAGEGSNWSGSQGFGFGVRDGYFTPGAPIFSGGLGALFDLDGDDDYQCAVMCQGFGYAFGTGLFYDRRGNDDHLITHKYALGSATHWAVGLYVDGDGDDTYRNNDDDECIGLGYDASVAFHIDQGDGDDVYTIDNFGEFVLGHSRIPALGVLINEGGDDEYHVPGTGSWAIGRSIAHEGNRDGYLGDVVSAGMFFDLGGRGDVYDIARDDVDNGAEWIQTTPEGEDWDPRYDHGYGLDTE